ncbi:MAG: phytanoyl-CoA dioxygenase family protein [Anaerolineaceae bacterium]|nr:phytanoyl-CoA dioxygenase family protein [Anaerolineaceae bacterium]
MLTQEQKQTFAQDGYLIVHGLFSKAETELLAQHYMDLHEKDATDADRSGDEDPLKRFPRLLMMHRYDPISLQWLLDRRIASVLNELLGKDPFAVQTMIYYKPPQARGQALHQDQYFLRAQPGTCIAAWMALDRCDDENGCLRVVPGSQDWPLLCTTKADTTQSFTDMTVPIPSGTEAVHALLDPGDVLFFNGQLVHGSGPNRTTDRFRRSLIGHYIEGDANQVATYYHPVLRMDGSEVKLDVSEGGGACGIWVDQDGQPMIELAGVEGLAGRTE